MPDAPQRGGKDGEGKMIPGARWEFCDKDICVNCIMIRQLCTEMIRDIHAFKPAHWELGNRLLVIDFAGDLLNTTWGHLQQMR